MSSLGPRLSHGRVALALAILLLAATPSWAQSGSDRSTNALADEVFWSLQERKLQPDLSEEGNARWLGELDGFERRLRRIKVSRLGRQAVITHRMVAQTIDLERRYVTEGWITQDLASMESLLMTVNDAVEATERRTVSDWRYVIERLESSDRFVEDYIALLRRGLAEGRVQPRFVVMSSLEQTSMFASASAARNPFVALEAELSETLAGHRRLPELRRALRAALEGSALPAFRRLDRFLRGEYLPSAPRGPGQGLEAYRFHVLRHLGPGHDPAELRAFAEREVARLQAELERTAREVDPDMRSLRAFIQGLDRRRANQFETAEDLLETTRAEVDRARRFAREVVRVPRSTITVGSIPRTDERTEDAQYIGTGPRSGVFQVNTTERLGSMGRHELASVAHHEHGHHIQGVFAQLDSRLPDFRRDATHTVYDEGWAMYLDHMRKARGEYSALERIGHLKFMLWAAAGMVVDIGMQTGDMTRRQGLEYMSRYMFTSPEAAEGEVERMLNMPGHMLAYYAGKREMLSIRRAVRRRLGPAFDERAFHERLLENGSIPLDVLRARMLEWADRRASRLGRGPAAGLTDALAREAELGAETTRSASTATAGTERAGTERASASGRSAPAAVNAAALAEVVRGAFPAYHPARQQPDRVSVKVGTAGDPRVQARATAGGATEVRIPSSLLDRIAEASAEMPEAEARAFRARALELLTLEAVDRATSMELDLRGAMGRAGASGGPEVERVAERLRGAGIEVADRTVERVASAAGGRAYRGQGLLDERVSERSLRRIRDRARTTGRARRGR